jgi:signal peptidase
LSTKKEILAYVVIIIIGLLIAQHMNVVVSGSMEPVFYRGDIVIVQKADLLGIQEFDPDSVQVGDIVVYDASWFSSPVIHRVINITEINGTTYYEIKGDNNQVPDPYWVTSARIKERVVTIGDQPLIIPKIGYITIAIKGL